MKSKMEKRMKKIITIAVFCEILAVMFAFIAGQRYEQKQWELPYHHLWMEVIDTPDGTFNPVDGSWIQNPSRMR